MIIFSFGTVWRVFRLQLNEASKKVCAKQIKQLQDLKRELTACKADAMESRGELEAKVALLTAKLEASQIDLVRIMIGTRQGSFLFFRPTLQYRYNTTICRLI